MVDTVRIFFDDHTSTIIHVSEDDDIRDAIAEMLETEGYDISNVIDYRIEEYRD